MSYPDEKPTEKRELDDLLATSDPLESIDPDLTTDAPPLSPTPIRIGRGSQSPSDLEATLDDQDRLIIDRICQAFQDRWKASDDPPNIESFLSGDLKPHLRQIIARELVRIDVAERQRSGSSIGKKEYLKRLPEFEDDIELAFSLADSGQVRQATKVNSGAGHRGDVAMPRENDPKARYQATEMHARGGLGAVYRARDRELKRVVALKEILPEHRDKEQYQEKFIFEAEVTGSLEHPGIVPVYGLGRYSDNQPYYAMRFIRGRSFSAVIKSFHLSHSPPSADAYLSREFRTMLRRLIDACNAIQFAHEHGVLHRDLKPANIMLGKYGETLVVDWGLAKLISRSAEVTKEGDQTTFYALSGSGSTKTRHGAIVGTPMYMSPEQAFGDHDALDGRSDVYSLGAILFNLITGTTPIEGGTSIDVIKNVRSGKIRRMDRLNPVAPKPLASICAKAMALDREQRYENATDLADDIDRWMNDELVLAHAAHENALERAGRLIRRYRSWSISGAAALLMISIIAVGSALLINRARRNEQLAKVQAKQYQRDALGRYRDSREAIDKWLVQSSDALEYFPGTQQVRKRLLEQAIGDYERLSKSPSADPALELERGRALVRVGELLQMQQDHDGAQRHFGSALEVFENRAGDPALRVAYDAEAAGTRIRIGVSLALQGRRADAEREYLDSIDALSNLAAESADDRARRLLASAHVNAGQFYLDSDTARAVEQLTNALSTLQSFGEGADEEIRLGTASTHNLLGQIHRIVDNQDRVATSLLENKTPGFTVYDVRGTCRPRSLSGLLFVFGIENFTDKTYREHLDFRSLSGVSVFQPGLNAYFGTDWNY
ncbi:serine/threonine-protein kinase [Stieleria sp. ICT_E10.1]|uniref:serine/threonine-protein kinase n=1 Tax=Stieleria sedimenti TaxID=2976331 RepID=UPI00217F5467|nr:serine/threonine-protein kinase [Stieleria sedimenti]MCS7471579.1 serine/threonine-protein kinase [Stieleria sedimenti]